MPKKYKLTIKALRERSPWEIAKALGIEYTGDMNPVPHGGTFYSLWHWEKHDYADCVHFSESEGTLWVEHSHVCRSLKQLPAAFKSWGWKISDGGVSDNHRGWTPITPQIEFEALLSYCGIECPSMRYTFKSDNRKDWGEFPEFQIFKAAKPLIESLAVQ